MLDSTLDSSSTINNSSSDLCALSNRCDPDEEQFSAVHFIESCRKLGGGLSLIDRVNKHVNSKKTFDHAKTMPGVRPKGIKDVIKRTSAKATMYVVRRDAYARPTIPVLMESKSCGIYGEGLT